VSWADVFSAVADTVCSVTNAVIQAVGDVIGATITMVVAGVTYVWDAIVTGVGQLLDLVQTIFSSLQAGFWALVGWLGRSGRPAERGRRLPGQPGSGRVNSGLGDPDPAGPAGRDKPGHRSEERLHARLAR
jgi:hypothetical protein